MKLADADLIGLPVRVVVSMRNHREGKVEVKARTGEPTLISSDAALSYLTTQH